MTFDNNPVIQKVIDIFAPGSLALAVTGSFARGTNTPYSDLDIIRYVPSEMLSTVEPYTLHIIDEQLVSLTHTTFNKVTADLNSPRLFFFVKPSLQQSRILFDPDGMLAGLIKSAETMHWSSLAEQSQAHISSTLAGLVEEVTKLLSGLHRNEPWTAIYAAEELLYSLCELMIIFQKSYLISENEFFLIPQQVVGFDSVWSNNFRIAIGMIPANGDEAGFIRKRVIAAMKLYAESCLIMNDSILETDRQVINWGVQRINDFLDQMG